VNAKLEEQKKIGDTVTLGFNLDINTKPYTVKYSTAGSITLEGSAADIKKKLEVNPKTQIPQILFTVYQHVFSAIYVLGSVLDTPYPPPDLLHPMAEKIQIISSVTPSKAQPENSPSVPPQIQQPVAGGDNPSAAAPAKEQKENLK
jgi:hypothetical protein